MECGKWGTLGEEMIGDRKEKMKKNIQDSPAADIISLDKIDSRQYARFKVGVEEVDRVLGGGLVPGSLVLMSGEPGIGKSTILAQIVNALSRNGQKALYVSGEESAAQVKDRFSRLNCDLGRIGFIGETNTDKILSAALKNKPNILIIDSIQTVYSNEVDGEAGGIAQIRANTVKYLEVAKRHDVAVILVGHITKDGQVAGPKSLEHIVDTVIHLESEKSGLYRLLRAAKNRFGSVNEVGIFEMTGGGFVEVKNPSSLFIDDGQEAVSGSVISSVMEGTRPFMVEIQALVSKTVFGYPQRKSSGFDMNRLQVLAAVLAKRANIQLGNQDIVVNIAGGHKVSDPGLDLAVCAAIISSLLNITVDKKTFILGEVGLGGEVRATRFLKERIKEAERLGFKSAIVPSVNIKSDIIKLIKIRKTEELKNNI